MSVPERKPEPGDLTEAELAHQHVLRRRRFYVVEEVDDDPLVVLVPVEGVGTSELALRVAAAVAHEKPQGWVAHADAIKSFLRAIVDDDFAAKLMARFDWTRHLPEADQRLFVETVQDELRRATTSGDLEPFFLLIDRWKSTAEVWADPETLAALTTDPDPTGDPEADPAL